MRRILALATAILILLLCGCSPADTAPSAEVTQPAATVSATEAPTEAPTEVPTQAPTEAPTEPPTEAPTEAPTEPPIPWLHSGIREDGTFDSGTLFIGDSLTYGLVESYLEGHDLLGDANYMAIPGATPAVYFYGPKLRSSGKTFCYLSPQFEGMLMSEAIEATGADLTAVYFMMGTNYSKAVTVDLYIDIINHLLEHCPNATIYLLRVPYESSDLVNGAKANERIEKAYVQFAAMEEPRLMLVDTETAIGRNQTTDGIHLTEKGQQLWYEELLRYAAANGIPQ